jgi:hypothetical protein
MQLFHTETSKLGVTRKFFSDDQGNITVETSQDLSGFKDFCNKSANERGKKITSDYANTLGLVPPVIVMKWLHEEGWFVFDADKDEAVQKKLKQKLNCSDWRLLRTSELRV